MMMARRRGGGTPLAAVLWLAGGLALGAGAACGGTEAADPASGPHLPEHPAQLPPLSADAAFPRAAAAELQAAGYPDHHHAYFWPGYVPPAGADGTPRGFGSLCEGLVPLERPGAVLGDDEACRGQVRLRFAPGGPPCRVVPLLELTHLALDDLQDWLGLRRADTLTVLCPADVPEYQARTGYGTWRLFARQPAGYVVQPVHVLAQRTLLGHAAYQLAADWLLDGHGGERLPEWLRAGITEYLAENGVHLVNYMAEFRPRGSVLLSAASADSLLAAGVDPDPGRDRQLFRQASYSAFLMTWHLVEERGGLAALGRFLGRVSAGDDPDVAARAVYGADLADLADQLDPLRTGEPIAPAFQPRRPHVPPPDWTGGPGRS
ncbi:MAG: hypothetical protein R6X25_11810 [Candidatus Krumholzibacteriia bacterium]